MVAIVHVTPDAVYVDPDGTPLSVSEAEAEGLETDNQPSDGEPSTTESDDTYVPPSDEVASARVASSTRPTTTWVGVAASRTPSRWTGDDFTA